MKNKGFSLVELIIVIAIMAILAAAIAPALIRYIDKSRRGDDVQAAATINTAVTATLANEDAYDEVAGKMDGSTVIASAAADGSTSFTATGATVFESDLNSNVANEAPGVKYTKNFTTGVSKSDYSWQVYVNQAGKPVVKLSVASGPKTLYELQPSIDTCYK